MVKKVMVLAMAVFWVLGGFSWAMKWDFHGSLINSVWSWKIVDKGPGSHKTDWFVTKIGNNTYYGQKSEKALTDPVEKLKKIKAASAFVGYTKGRLRFEGVTNDGLAKFVYGIEVGGCIWGDKDKGFAYSGDGHNLETRFLYGELQLAGGLLRAGLQPTKINHWVWTETAAGLSYHYKTDLYSLMLGWYRGDVGEDKFGMDSKNDLLVVKGDYKMNPDLNLGGFLVYHNQGKEKLESVYYNNHSYYLGFTGEGKFAPFFFAWDAIYQGGKIEFEENAAEEMSRSAWLLHIKGGYEVNDNLKVWARFLYVTGDNDVTGDDDVDNKINNFESVDVDVKIGMLLFKEESLRGGDHNYLDAPYIGLYGLINYALYGEYKLNSKHKVTMAAMYHQTAVNFKDNDNEYNDLGWELDLWYSYKYNKNVTYKVEAAYLKAGEVLKNFLAEDKDKADMYFLGAGIVFKF